MTAAGEAAIVAAVENGMWDFLNEVEAGLVPEDLQAALTGPAAAIWDSFPKSVKRGTLEWLAAAETPNTRSARITEIAGSAALGLRPKPFRR